MAMYRECQRKYGTKLSNGMDTVWSKMKMKMKMRKTTKKWRNIVKKEMQERRQVRRSTNPYDDIIAM